MHMSFLESTGGAKNGQATSTGTRPRMRRDKGSRKRLRESKSRHEDGRAESENTAITDVNPKLSAVTVAGDALTEPLDSHGNFESTKNQRRSKKDRKGRN